MQDQILYGGRYTAGYLLDMLYQLGSVAAVANKLYPHINQDQIKEAIAFAKNLADRA